MLNPKLNTYIRIDANGRDIAGTNVLRTKMPVTGRWRQLEAHLCCGPSISIETTPEDTYVSNIVLSVLCNAVEVMSITSTGDSTTIEEMVEVLNTNFSYLGTFTTDGTTIVLKLHLSIAETLCADGTLTMEVLGTPTTTTTTAP